MNSRRLLAATMVALAASAQAGSINEQQAREIASKFLASSQVSTRATGNAKLDLAAKSSGYYAFNRTDGAGFVLVASSDDGGEQVLGYADHGSFSSDRMPTNMREWLAEYDRQVAFAANHPGKYAATRADGETKKAIAPIVTAHWGQDAPYNTMCPIDKDNGYRSAVGCTATAVAQVMYTHKWPKQGQGSITYTSSLYSAAQEITVDFSQSTYNWDAMKDTYSYTDTGEAADAVALLMRDVGAAAKMEYSASASGAYMFEAGAGLVSYFDYDPGMTYVWRNAYTHKEWDDMMYAELENGRPIPYTGANRAITEAHAFVVDGYQDGYYHINWGWDGMSDGYFKLSALDPIDQGTGGSDDSYNYDQLVLVGVQPNTGVAVEDKPNVVAGAMTVGKVTSNQVELGLNLRYLGLFERELQAGVKVKSTDGDSTYVLSSRAKRMTGETLVTTTTLNLSDFPSKDGTYTLTAIVYDLKTQTYCEPRALKAGLGGGSTYLTAVVKDGAITFSSPAGQQSSLSVTDISLPSTIYAGMSYIAHATVAATDGDYYDDVQLRFALGDSIANSEFAHVDLAEGESATYAMYSVAPSLSGTYKACLVDSEGNALGDTLTVSVADSITSELAFEAKGFRMDKTTDVDPNDIHMEFDVKCTGGTYCNMFYVVVFNAADDNDYTYISSDGIVSMVEGDEATVSFTTTLSGLKPATEYDAYVIYLIDEETSNYIQPYSLSGIHFTTAASSGISAAETDGEPTLITIYTLGGTLVASQRAATPNLGALPKGVYIVKQGGKTSKMVR